MEAKEINAPTNGSIKWRLLTTHCVESLEDALRIINIYRLRWYIEQVFRLLKKKGFAVDSSELTTGWGISKLTLLLLNNILPIMPMLMGYGNEESLRTEEVFSEKEIECLKRVGSDLSMTHRF